jgi:diacylglycerol kinase
MERERRAFAYAFQGVAHAWRSQPHMRVHAGLGALAIVGAAWFGIAAVEWAVLLLTITVVLVLELLNTVVEAVVDVASPGIHPLAKVAKDVAAAAVLVGAIGSVCVGVALFGPRLWRLLS